MLHSTEVFTRATVRIIERNAESNEPFFLYLAYTAPHDPLQSQPQWMESETCRNKSHNSRRQTYCSMVVGLDLGTKSITDALTVTGALDSTIIFFASDNGDHPMVDGLNAPYRGMKVEAWEGGTNVPAFIHWPSKIRPHRFDGLFHLVDVNPIVLTMVDTALNRKSEVPLIGVDSDGLDQSSQLLNDCAQGKKCEQRHEVLLECDGVKNMTALIRVVNGTRWKIVLGSAGDDGFHTKPIDTRWCLSVMASRTRQR